MGFRVGDSGPGELAPDPGELAPGPGERGAGPAFTQAVMTKACAHTAHLDNSLKDHPGERTHPFRSTCATCAVKPTEPGTNVTPLGAKPASVRGGVADALTGQGVALKPRSGACTRLPGL